MELMSFVQEAFSEDTGGGFEADVFVLDDGTVLVISEDAIVLYASAAAWAEPGSGGELGVIPRR